jgi:hypothetical protein
MDELMIVAAHLVGAQVSHIPHATPRVVVDMYVDVLRELSLRRMEIAEAAEPLATT